MDKKHWRQLWAASDNMEYKLFYLVTKHKVASLIRLFLYEEYKVEYFCKRYNEYKGSKQKILLTLPNKAKELLKDPAYDLKWED